MSTETGGTSMAMTVMRGRWTMLISVLFNCGSRDGSSVGFVVGAETGGGRGAYEVRQKESLH